MLFMRAMMNLSAHSELWNEVFVIWRNQPPSTQKTIIQVAKSNPEKYAALIAEIAKLRMKS
jgi:hypothetical protein